MNESLTIRQAIKLVEKQGVSRRKEIRRNAARDSALDKIAASWYDKSLGFYLRNVFLRNFLIPRKEKRMRALIFERIKADSHVQRAIRQKNKKFLLWLSLFAAVVLLFTLLLCHLASFAPHHWGIALAIAAAVAVVPFLVFFFTRKPKIHVGRITRIEETHKLIPEEGDEILRRWQPRRAEVETHQILVAFTDEEGETEVLFLPPSYEKLLSVGDVLLSHSALPYPAHLSCPTASLCMHCGSVQAAENETCSTCGAPLYSVFTLKK